MKNDLFLCLLVSVLLIGCQSHPTAEQRRQQKHQQDSIALVQQERTLDYYQTQLDSLMPHADSLLRLFAYDRDERYQDNGYYGKRSQQSSHNAGRCYPQVLVRDDGRAQVRFFYYGTSHIDFQRVTLAVEDLEITLSGSVHSFEAEGWHQILTLQDSTAYEALRFIDAHERDRVRVSYKGESRTGAVYYLNDQDREALLQGYALSVVMTDVYELEKRIRHTALEVQKYQKRLQKN